MRHADGDVSPVDVHSESSLLGLMLETTESLACSEEMSSVIERVKSNDVSVQHSIDHLDACRQCTEQLGGWERDVPEQYNSQRQERSEHGTVSNAFWK